MKRRFKVDKLIRDKMPNIMRADGVDVFERVMESEEYVQRLKDKLLEEAKEVCNANTQQDIKGELADLFEVVRALTAVNGFEIEDIIKTAELKRKDRGGFDSRIYNAFVEIEEGNPVLEYYLFRPEHYPQIM